MSADIASALKYIEGSDPFARQRIEAGLANGSVAQDVVMLDSGHALPASTSSSVTEVEISTMLDLHFTLEPHNAQVRGESKARRALETCCLKNVGMQIVDAAAGRYRIVIDHTA